MQNAPIPANEAERIAALHKLSILDTPTEERFDRITKAAVDRLNIPISTISIIDEDREWFKSCQGLKHKEGDRTVSFCGHAMLAPQIFIVEDTLRDDRFKDNPMVVNPPHIRFYAGVALHEPETHLPIGVLCVKDTQPRAFSPDEIAILMELAAETEQELAR